MNKVNTEALGLVYNGSHAVDGLLVFLRREEPWLSGSFRASL